MKRLLRSSARVAAAGAVAGALAVGCGAFQRAPSAAPSAVSGGNLLPDVRIAEGRPPVVLVAREGDPAAAVAFAVMTGEVDAEPAAALAGVVSARIAARSLGAVVTPSWDGLRGSILVANAADAARATEAIRAALTTPIGESDLAPARAKLAALAQRPLGDPSLARWARCVGSPHAAADRAGKPAAIDVATLEGWRRAAHGKDTVALGVAGPHAVCEAVAAGIARAPEWRASSSAPPNARTGAGVTEVAVYEASSSIAPVVHVALDVGTGTAAVATAEALGDPRGPLAARLANLDTPFRVREVVGTAHARGGCVGAVLEPMPVSGSRASGDLAARVADAFALLYVEAGVHLEELATARDGRTLARRSGDAREAAERAAWWGLVDTQRGAERPGSLTRASVALGVSAKRAPADAAALEPPREAFAKAVEAATLAWKKPVVEGRARVEAGQGEAWVLVASPCGTQAEGEADAGLSALFVTAAAEAAKSSPDARVEPWVVPDGVGLLAHGPARPGETPAAHARRLADVVGRSFAAEPIASPALTRARADLLARDARVDGPSLGVLATALAPGHPAWVVALGSVDPLTRSSDGAVRARAQALRSGPIRVAVLANASEAQADAAIRAADRWVTRRSGEVRACPAPPSATPPRPGTYAAPFAAGDEPEAYLAFPLPAGDDAARDAATVVAAALGGDGALLDKALSIGSPSALARDASARVLGWPRAPALVVRVVAPQASLDAAVMQTRALVDRVHKGGLSAADLERAAAAAADGALGATLDPRARVVATWRGEALPRPRPRVTVEDVRAFAQRHLAEDAMIVVASRPPRPAPPRGP